MEDYLVELHEDVERMFQKINQSSHDLVLLGQEIERVEIFDGLRALIIEKESSDDDIAVQVLSWAYERLSEATR
jgi:hypothetical protein